MNTQATIPTEKIGKYVQRVLPSILRTLNQDEVNKLCDLQYCKDTFGLNFVLLSKEKNIVKGYYRSYCTPVVLLKTKFYMTSQWYECHRGRLEAWIVSHKKSR